MKRKKFLKGVVSLLMALMMVLTLNVPGSMVEAAGVSATIKTIYDVPADLTGKTVIMHTNDIHGAISKYAYIASVKQNLQKRGAEVILADAGDFSQGTPYVSTSKGLNAVTMMNAAGYDIVTLGNHEFDFGYYKLVSNLSTAKFKVVCADILDASGNPVFNPNYMYTTKSGVKIGFFGMETPETLTKVNPGLIQGLTFLKKDDLAKCAQAQADTLKAQGADIVICLSHLGVDDESAPDGHRSIDVYAKTKGIDLMLDGHSHTVMTMGPKNEPVQSTGTKVETIGLVFIDNATKKIEDRYLINLEGLQEEVTTAAKSNKMFKEVDNVYGAVFANSDIKLNGDRDPGNRTEETNLGDLITDAMLWSVLRAPGALTVDKDHVISITNGGGIRASIDAGAVSMKDVNTVLPFGNTVAVVYVTGEELLEALEASTYCTPKAIGGFPQVSGIKFTVNTTKSFAQGPAYPGSTYYKPASINRVSIDSINGQPFDKAATYAVVTNNFCAAGGDTYFVFKNASAQFDTGIPLDEAVMDYVKETLGGRITSEAYGSTNGNITIIK